MGKVISFGDSFVVGLGTDREYEQSLTGAHPDWDTMSETDKNKQREKVNIFRRANSFTAFFSSKMKMECINLGRIGCDNQVLLMRYSNMI